MKRVYELCMAIGILIVMASIGSSICGNLDGGQAVWNIIGGLLIGFVGDAGLGVLEVE